MHKVPPPPTPNCFGQIDGRTVGIIKSLLATPGDKNIFEAIIMHYDAKI